MERMTIEKVRRQMRGLVEYLVNDLPWSKHLTLTERWAFLGDLARACAEVDQTGSPEALRIILDEWEETAALVSDPTVVAQAQRPIPEQDLVAWETVRDALPGRAAP